MFSNYCQFCDMQEVGRTANELGWRVEISSLSQPVPSSTDRGLQVCLPKKVTFDVC